MEKNRGYWCVAGEYYDNKVKAIIAAQHRNLILEDISYHYNDAWWNKIAWDVEPAESIQELYVRRAHQLREKYKTIIIRLSGGADSTNILRTFVDNNIKVDVVTMNEWHEPGTDPWLPSINIEKKLLAKPLVDQLIKKGAQFEVITNDFSPTISVLGNDPAWIFDIDAPKFSLIDITACRALTTSEFDRWNDPSTAVIVGVDKPKVFCKDEKIWYFSIPDLLHTMHNPANLMTPEPFYWTADIPEIVVKQCHLVKNFWKNHIDKLDGISVIKKTQTIPLIYPEYFKHVDPLSDKLPYWDHEDINHRYRNSIRGPRGWGWDWQFHKSPYYQVWKDGIDLADRLIERKFKDQDSIWKNGLKEIWSKPRWLGK